MLRTVSEIRISSFRLQNVLRYLSADAEGSCFFWAANGKIYPGNTDFGGEPAQPGDRIGILLDLDAWCFSSYKNGQHMGVVRLDPDHTVSTDRTISEGYCWAVTMPTHVTVRVEPRLQQSPVCNRGLGTEKTW
jgi:hypothetical protein